jgi:ubiquitin-protein ligase
MSARLRRLAADWQEVQKDFATHKNISVTPIAGDPPEKYNVTYLVNGIFLLPDGRIETLGRHEVEITLHADYPRYKPICKINTPIWHPNFRDGEVCIGDIWGAGESLSDIIINIGNMIQYKSWNSYSPLSFDAAKWAIENQHLFPVGTTDLYITESHSANENVSIDVFDTHETGTQTDAESSHAKIVVTEASHELEPSVKTKTNDTDFDITAEELAGIEFVPSVNRMQTIQGSLVRSKRIDFRTILAKGILWACIGAIFGYAFSEIWQNFSNRGVLILRVMNQQELADWRQYQLDNFAYLDNYLESAELTRLYNRIDLSEKEIKDYNEFSGRLYVGIWTMLFSLGLALFLGLGEGIYYGSKENALRFALIGTCISVLLGLISGYMAQVFYETYLNDESSNLASSLIRGVSWAMMGLGIGLSAGLIKPELRRLFFCTVGGLAGGFLGGFVFNYIFPIISLGTNDDGIVPRFVGLLITGLLIGLGIGLLEQVAKQAWLKVIRGDFEGKEYLVFAGTTSIGNNGKNTIVLFKDKLVGAHHCDIVQEGSRYVLVDKGTTTGTTVNGMRTTRHILRQGDAIAVGNSVLVFNTK